MIQVPPLDLLQALFPQLAHFARAVVGVFPLLPPQTSLTSWWRDPISNQRVGGHPQSQHRLALAMDFAAPDAGRLVAALRRSGLVVIDEGDHVHVQLYPAGALPPGAFRW
jgi:hypothetical protein